MIVSVMNTLGVYTDYLISTIVDVASSRRRDSVYTDYLISTIVDSW